jgi:hypothetical protein
LEPQDRSKRIQPDPLSAADAEHKLFGPRSPPPAPSLIIIESSRRDGITMSSFDPSSTPDAKRIVDLLEAAAKAEHEDDSCMPYILSMLHAMRTLQSGKRAPLSPLVSSEQRAQLLTIRDWGRWDACTDAATPYLACIIVSNAMSEDLDHYLRLAMRDKNDSL